MSVIVLNVNNLGIREFRDLGILELGDCEFRDLGIGLVSRSSSVVIRYWFGILPCEHVTF